MHLDRDDVGSVKDEIRNKRGEVIRVEQNQEIVTIRGYIPGEYIVNVFLYSKIGKGPTPINTQIIKMNPFQIIHEEAIILKNKGEEHTVTRFIVNDDGLVTNKNDMFKSLIKWKK